MKLSFSNILLYLVSLTSVWGQVSSPNRFSLKSTEEGEVSYFDDGFSSKIEARGYQMKVVQNDRSLFETGISEHTLKPTYIFIGSSKKKDF